MNSVELLAQQLLWDRVKAGHRERSINVYRECVYKRVEREFAAFNGGNEFIAQVTIKGKKPRYFKFDSKSLDELQERIYYYLIDNRTSLNNTPYELIIGRTK